MSGEWKLEILKKQRNFIFFRLVRTKSLQRPGSYLKPPDRCVRLLELLVRVAMLSTMTDNAAKSERVLLFFAGIVDGGFMVTFEFYSHG